jgi:hypothetical protein
VKPKEIAIGNPHKKRFSVNEGRVTEFASVCVFGITHYQDLLPFFLALVVDAVEETEGDEEPNASGLIQCIEGCMRGT